MAEERSATESGAASSTRVERIATGVRHIHLIGAGGSAMAALAGMLAEHGFRVTGSDNQLYEPAASVLLRLRIDVRPSYAPSNLDPPPDLEDEHSILFDAGSSATVLPQ
jgi:UDP-N-acetylmuramate-alanine ligase